MLYKVIIEIESGPSHLDVIFRQGFDQRPYMGSPTRKETSTEEYLVGAESRDQAIANFRDITGYRGRIDRCFHIAESHEKYERDKFQRRLYQLSLGSLF